MVAIPRTSTANPQPDMIHHPTWLAAAKLTSPERAAATAEPMTATPSDWPSCRLVDATAAATPDWDGGIPETAVKVIGEFTIEIGRAHV